MKGVPVPDRHRSILTVELVAFLQRQHQLFIVCVSLFNCSLCLIHLFSPLDQPVCIASCYS